jgi:hypothetical protein
MNTTLKSLLLLIVVTISLLAVSPVHATPPAEAEGTFELTGLTINSIRQAGSNTIIDETLSIDNVGDVNGPSVADVICVFRSSGEGVCHGRETFTGSVDGKNGTLVFSVVMTIDEAFNLQGRWTVISGTEELANLRGTGTFAGTTTGTYSLKFHFDPS